MKLKDNLRFLRRKAGLTQAELAKKMHLRQYNISDYEIGRIEPNIQTLIRFADIFDVSLDFLVGRKQESITKAVMIPESNKIFTPIFRQCRSISISSISTIPSKIFLKRIRRRLQPPLPSWLKPIQKITKRV